MPSFSSTTSDCCFVDSSFGVSSGIPGPTFGSLFLSACGFACLVCFIAFTVLPFATAFRLVFSLLSVEFCAAVLVAATLVLVAFAGAAFVAAARAADAFVVAVLAEAVFDTELFKPTPSVVSVAFGTDAALVVFLAFVVFTPFSSSASAFFARPRRAGAFRTLDLRGDSGGVTFVCARCARVRTIVFNRCQ
jgi:hypothetical protein